MKVDVSTGEMLGVRQVRSPNCDARPAGMQPELIVVHGISLPPGEFGGPWIERLFTNTLPLEVHPYFRAIGALRVSAHLVIGREGALTQYVKFTDRAWHAGASCYEGREACNDFSIGVELEGADDLPYASAQYESLARSVAALWIAYPTLGERMAAHSEISPGRKTDPGPAFDWVRARATIADHLRGR